MHFADKDGQHDEGHQRLVRKAALRAGTRRRKLPIHGDGCHSHRAAMQWFIACYPSHAGRQRRDAARHSCCSMALSMNTLPSEASKVSEAP